MHVFELTSDKDYILASGEGEDIENTRRLNLKITDAAGRSDHLGDVPAWDDKGISNDWSATNNGPASVRVRNVAISFYSDLATKNECQGIELRYVKDPTALVESYEEKVRADSQVILTKTITIKGEAVPCSFQIEMRKVITHFRESGKGHIRVTANLSDGAQVSQELAFERVLSVNPEILDFYPDHGSAVSGASVGVNWNIQGSITGDVKAYLEGGGATTQILTQTGRKEVVVPRTTDYTLKLSKNDEKIDERTIKIQVLPVYLKTFRVDEDRKNARWEVCCATQITLDGTPCSPEEIENETQIRADRMTLKASDGNDAIISTLYGGKDPGQEEKDILHFRKTLSRHGGVWLLNVEWQKVSLARAGARAARGLRLELENKKTGLRETFYESDGEDIEAHEWEMLLEGCDASTISQDIQVTMDVVPVDGAPYTIKI